LRAHLGRDRISLVQVAPRHARVEAFAEAPAVCRPSGFPQHLVSANFDAMCGALPRLYHVSPCIAGDAVAIAASLVKLIGTGTGGRPWRALAFGTATRRPHPAPPPPPPSAAPPDVEKRMALARVSALFTHQRQRFRALLAVESLLATRVDPIGPFCFALTRSCAVLASVSVAAGRGESRSDPTHRPT